MRAKNTNLIGQPTWINATEIQFQTVLRGDLVAGDTEVSFPETVFGVQPINGVGGISYADLNSMLTYSGTATLYKVMHVGDSRSPDGMQWRTDCWAWTSGQSSSQAAQTSGGIGSDFVAGQNAAAVAMMAAGGGLQSGQQAAGRLGGRKVRRWR